MIYSFRRLRLIWLRILSVIILMIGAVQLIVGQTATVTVSPEPDPSSTESPALLDALASARFEPLNPRLLTGQAFTIELIITLPSGLELVELPQFSDPWGEFELRSASTLQAESQPDGVTVFRQQLEVVLWEPRDYVTPETFIGYRQTGFSDIQRLPVTPANITVPTVLDFDDLTLRPYKPLVYLPYLSPWLVLLVALLAVGLILVVRRWWQGRPRRTPAELTLPPTAEEIAVWALDALSSSSAYSSSAAPELRMIDAADTLRRYLAARFEVPLQERAATVNALQGQLPHTIRTALDGLLQQADLIKFSGGEANDFDASAYVERCQQWLKVVKDLDRDLAAELL